MVSDPTLRASHFLAPAVLLLVFAAAPLAGQDDVQSPAVAERPVTNRGAATENNAGTKTGTKSETETAPAAETEAERRHKTRVVEVAGLLLLLLVAGGVLLIATVIVWGARARRIVRAPLPSRPELDPLWYLRKKPRPSHEDDAAPDAKR
jgi:hypothetical protein